MIQQKGESCQRWPHLNGLTPAQFFSTNILIPLGDKIIEEKPTINTTLPNLMRKNLTIMKQKLKKSKKKVYSSEKKKCVSCSTYCIAESDTKPSRQCENCGNLEHNYCYDKDGKKGTLIKTGQLEFNCTICCTKNPELVLKRPSPKAVEHQNLEKLLYEGEHDSEKIDEIVVDNNVVSMTKSLLDNIVDGSVATAGS